MNKWLKGNGHWCPACKGTGRGELSDIIGYQGGGEARFYKKCLHCNGERRLPGPRHPDIPEPTCGFMNQCLEYLPPPPTSQKE